MSSPKPEKNNRPGLLKNSKPVFLAFAKIRKPHGLKGEVTVEMLSDFPDQFNKGDQVFIGETYHPYTLREIKKAAKTYLLSFQELKDRNAVEGLRNQIVYIKSDALSALPDGEYFHHDLIGMEIFDLKETFLGIISEIITTGANDVYVVTQDQDENREVLLPAIKSVIKKVDVQARRIVVDPPEWL